ncbi:MAG TPA: RecX family transcriptional regulator [Novosphingobium sp.]|nr:RecX family transcriptional regulator [Novosphingobium sp.]
MDDVNHTEAGSGRRGRVLRPISPARLDEMALAYVARFATSAGKLEAYLARKLRERGFDGDGEPAQAIAAILARFVAAGYVDDAGYARMRAGSLLRRGMGARRIAQDLNMAGIGEDVRAQAMPGEAAARAAALQLARKRGFGPFARLRGDGASDAAPDASADFARREKQVAAMLRAGHRLDMARAIIESPDAEAAQSWADEVRDEA